MSIAQILMLIIAVCTSLLQNMGIPLQVTSGQISEPIQTLATSEVVIPTPTVVPVDIERQDANDDSWTYRLWATGEGNNLYWTDTPSDPASFQFENQLGGDFADSSTGYAIDLATGPTGTLWILSNKRKLYRFDDDHPDNVVFIDYLPHDIEFGSAIAFDAEGKLWLVGVQRGTSRQGRLIYEGVIGEQISFTGHGRLGVKLESVSSIAFHDSALLITENRRGEAFDRLFELPNPRTPDTVIERGEFPGDLGNVGDMASDGQQLWISDSNQNVVEFWSLDDPTSAANAVEVGDIQADNGRLTQHASGLVFQKVLITEEPEQITPATPGDIWLASSDALYKLSEGAAPSEIKKVGDLEGAFLNDLYIVSIDFDSQGRLYILAVHKDSGSKHKLYRLENMANPRDAYLFSHLEGIEGADGLGPTRPGEVIVDAQDVVWVYDEIGVGFRLVDGVFERVMPCPDGWCPTPETFAHGKGYAKLPSGVFSFDFTPPYALTEIGPLPEEGRSLRAPTAGESAFWGIRKEGVEQHLWRIPNIEAPGEAVKFGEFPERMPNFGDMAVYRTEK